MNVLLLAMIFRNVPRLNGIGRRNLWKPLFQQVAGLKQVGEAPTITPLSRQEFRTMTAHVFRQEKTYKAVVKKVFNASKSIKVLRLHVAEPGFSFKAGQWVDFYVPGIEDVTGYSMTSLPFEAIQEGILDLAVKYGKFPPTHWVHTNCKGGEEVFIRVGGDFHYDPQPQTAEATADLLLIGGGVGINPLVSILLEYCHLLKTGSGLGIFPGKLHLMYSAKTEQELIFKDIFMQVEVEHPSITCRYFITNSHYTSEPDPECTYHRLAEKDVINAVKHLQSKNLLCYICGPSTMTDDVALILEKMGVKKDFIRYEKWW